MSVCMSMCVCGPTTAGQTNRQGYQHSLPSPPPTNLPTNPPTRPPTPPPPAIPSPTPSPPRHHRDCPFRFSHLGLINNDSTSTASCFYSLCTMPNTLLSSLTVVDSVYIKYDMHSVLHKTSVREAIRLSLVLSIFNT